MPRIIAFVLLVAYTAFVAHLTLTDPAQGRWAFGLADRFATSASSGRLGWHETEQLANIALFVPAGALLAVVLGRAWPAAVVVCVLASVSIEYAQLRYLPSRVPSLHDVQLNSLGGLIGALAGAVLLAVVAASHRRGARLA